MAKTSHMNLSFFLNYIEGFPQGVIYRP